MANLYFDFAASTPVDRRVIKAMQPFLENDFGNPGSLHSYGQKAIAAIDAAREYIAKTIGAKFREVIFTGSATEANNLALRGSVTHYRKEHPGEQPRIIISAIEHESVLETARELGREGAEIVTIPVGQDGVIDLKALQDALTEQTVIISVLYANNEIGTLQPIHTIAESVKKYRAEHSSTYPLVHTDAAQAFQYFDCNVETLGVDLMTLSAHKLYGPKGIGALYVRRNAKGNVSIAPMVLGGGQEFGIRSGTENVPSIVGFAKTIELAEAARAHEIVRVEDLRDLMWRSIKKAVPTAEVNGPAAAPHAPHILNIYFPGYEAQDLLIRFDRGGVAVSAGSACRSRAIEPSYVLQAIGTSKERSKESIRFSFGRTTTKTDISRATKLFPEIFRNK